MEENLHYECAKIIAKLSGRHKTKIENECDCPAILFFIIDFANWNISSACLRVLVTVQKKLHAEGIPFEIIHINDTIKEIFTQSGFDKILTIK